ncbi:MAG: hypothetical protein ACI8RD_000991 [Bacillariaceae sp.]|jgi:hypothetical protein
MKNENKNWMRDDIDSIFSWVCHCKDNDLVEI